jgi:monovalent cation:proton antiporter-2 (CPA2) family protein
MPHENVPFLREAVAFLVAALVVVPVFHRLRVSPLLGYLAVGVVIGPRGLGLLAGDYPWLGYVTVADVASVSQLAGLGVVFLLFMVGLELSAERLWTMRYAAFGLGGAQVLACGAAIGLIAWAWGNAPEASLILGASLALSSTAVVMQLLSERGAVPTRLGRNAVAVLLFQDLAVVPLLILAGALGAGGGRSIAADLALALAKAAVAIAAILALGRLLLRPLYRRIAALRSRELFVALTLLVVIGTAQLTALAGLSMALGAFMAGLVLAESEYRHQVEAEIAPFKGLLLGLFFIAVGMSIDPGAAAASAAWLAPSVLGLYALKAAVTGALGLAFRLPAAVAWPLGLLLGQGGEFGFLVAGVAVAGGVLPPAAGQFMLLTVALTMMATPVVAVAADRLAAALQRRAGARDAGAGMPAPSELEGHVVIAGFGRVGRMVARFLAAQGVPYVAVDGDAALVAQERRARAPVYYGNVAQPEMLRRLGLDRALALVVTINDPGAVGALVTRVRQAWPKLKLFVRTRDAAHSRDMLGLGATQAVPETVEASLQLAGRVLEGIGAPDETVGKLIAEVRAQELAQLRAAPGPPAAKPG